MLTKILIKIIEQDNSIVYYKLKDIYSKRLLILLMFKRLLILIMRNNKYYNTITQ